MDSFCIGGDKPKMLLSGNIDVVEQHRVVGWAVDDGNPDAPVTLHVTIDGQPPLVVVADDYRPDLERAGYGDGRHGFSFDLPSLPGLNAHRVQVQREDGAHLRGSPFDTPPSMRFDEAFKAGLSRMLADVGSADELLPRAAFLAQSADRLLQMRADERSGAPGALAAWQLRARWTGQPPPPQPGKRALVIAAAISAGKRDDDARGLAGHMASLQRLGYRVVFAPSDMADGSDGKGAAALEAAGIACCCAPWCGSVEEVLRRERDSFDVAYLRNTPAAAYLPLVRLHQPRAVVVLGLDKLHHLRLAEEAVLQQRAELAEESRRMREAELSAARLADAVLTPSAMEAAALGRSLPAGRVRAAPWAVPLSPTATPLAERVGLAYIGDFARQADVAAAWWVVQTLLPALQARDPAITCLLVGDGMPDTLRAVAAAGVRVLDGGRDLAEVFGQVRLTVAPRSPNVGDAMALGPVLDSLAAGVPCVCLPPVARALGWEGALLEMVSERDGIADVAARLHADFGFNAACGQAGLSHAAANASEMMVDAAMVEALGSTTGLPPDRVC